jgi:hypothetical protein
MPAGGFHAKRFCMRYIEAARVMPIYYNCRSLEAPKPLDLKHRDVGGKLKGGKINAKLTYAFTAELFSRLVLGTTRCAPGVQGCAALCTEFSPPRGFLPRTSSSAFSTLSESFSWRYCLLNVAPAIADRPMHRLQLSLFVGMPTF